MSTQISLPDDYRYIAAALVSTVCILCWQTTVVHRYRKKSGIAYPQLYAERTEALESREAYLFNCAQRAHQNTLELMPVILITTLVSGVKHPILAASACALWAFTRVLYTIGYTTGDVAKRNNYGGTLGQIPFFGLILASIYVAYQLFVGA